MNILVTGGAGFIGRWTVYRFLQEGHQVSILDDFSTGSVQNILEFAGNPRFKTLISGDMKDRALLKSISFSSFDVCVHLAGVCNVQESILDPWPTFSTDVIGTFHLLECCRKSAVKMVYLSTCLIYEDSSHSLPKTEEHGIKLTSPYEGVKLSVENMLLSYYHSYGFPVVILRPSSIYGPYQKGDGEGGKIAKYIQHKIKGEAIPPFGDSKDKIDYLYVEDCADFIFTASLSDQGNGGIFNGGLGTTINSQKAEKVLGWKAHTSFEDGMRRTEQWFRKNSLK